ncbi:MAG: pilus assembly protein PilM [Phycisphaeraceae bacterium]|nr:pilus assembly protein PilM [Phycisphaeraceae bacterium]
MESPGVWGWSKSHRSPIALDFGVDSLKALQVQPGDPPRLLAAAMTPVPEEARFEPQARQAFHAQALRDLIKRGGFRGRKAVCCLPATQTLVQSFDLLRGEDSSIENQIGLHLRERLHVDPSRMVIRTFPVPGPASSKQEVICVAASREAVMRQVAAARRAGLDVTAMHCEPLAILKAFAHLYRRAEDQTRVTCFLDIGAATTRVVIARGREMIFAKTIHVAGDHFTRSHAKLHDTSFTDARQTRWSSDDEPGDSLECLIDELQLCLRHHQMRCPDQPVDRVVFLGGESRHTAFCQVIARSLRIAAQLGDPLARLQRAPGATVSDAIDLQQPQPGWSVCMGLCLCDVS